jgi:hypothetical protein
MGSVSRLSSSSERHKPGYIFFLIQVNYKSAKRGFLKKWTWHNCHNVFVSDALGFVIPLFPNPFKGRPERSYPRAQPSLALWFSKPTTMLPCFPEGSWTKSSRSFFSHAYCVRLGTYEIELDLYGYCSNLPLSIAAANGKKDFSSPLLILWMRLYPRTFRSSTSAQSFARRIKKISNEQVTFLTNGSSVTDTSMPLN